jgi:hypothetical protein
MTSPYELIVHKPVGVRMIRNCSQCLFFDPDSHNINGTLHTRCVFNRPIFASYSYRSCVMQVYALQHRITGEVLTAEQAEALYAEHRRSTVPL